MTDLKYDHLLVNLRHAERIACVRCEQTFKQSDRYTRCPNSADGGHALIPMENY